MPLRGDFDVEYVLQVERDGGKKGEKRGRKGGEKGEKRGEQNTLLANVLLCDVCCAFCALLSVLCFCTMRVLNCVDTGVYSPSPSGTHVHY